MAKSFKLSGYKPNEYIRTMVRERKISLREVANRIPTDYTTLMAWLAKEPLSKQRENIIIRAIEGKPPIQIGKTDEAECKFNRYVNCGEQDKCDRCGWNPSRKRKIKPFR